MKNSQQPIYPCIMQQVGENEYRLHKDGDPREHRIPLAGLTKREHFAGIAMQGIIDGAYFNGEECLTPAEVAELAIQYGDELLKQLDK